MTKTFTEFLTEAKKLDDNDLSGIMAKLHKKYPLGDEDMNAVFDETLKLMQDTNYTLSQLTKLVKDQMESIL